MFWAYLWGIETLKNPITSSYMDLCFEPTYEELKPSSFCNLLHCLCKFWAYLWGIETREKGNPSAIERAVLSLPMRNWNKAKGLWVYIQSKFWAYLWGIETWMNLVAVIGTYHVLSLPMRNWNFATIVLWSKLCVTFWAYLWGIETWHIFFCRCGFLVCFEPTYEELKQNSNSKFVWSVF